MSDKQKVVIAIGEILFDVFENKGYESMGGAPFNFAFHISKFLGDVKFVSAIGVDERGDRIISKLATHEFPSEYIQRKENYPTGTVIINLNEEGIPDYEIIKDVAYDNIILEPNLEELVRGDVDLIYFGTLAQRNQASQDTIRAIIEKSQAKIKFCDLNLRKDTYTEEAIEYSLKACNYLKLNEDELQFINIDNSFGENNNEIVSAIAEHYNIDNICVTLGEQGSMLYSKGAIYLKIIPKEEVIDTVGAGDAFSSVMMIGAMQDKSPKDILQAASYFSAKVCNLEGAVPNDSGWYERLSEELEEYING